MVWRGERGGQPPSQPSAPTPAALPAAASQPGRQMLGVSSAQGTCTGFQAALIRRGPSRAPDVLRLWLRTQPMSADTAGVRVTSGGRGPGDSRSRRLTNPPLAAARPPRACEADPGAPAAGGGPAISAFRGWHRISPWRAGSAHGSKPPVIISSH